MTLNELKQQEALLNEEYAKEEKYRETIEFHNSNQQNVLMNIRLSTTLDRMIDIHKLKIECLKAQIKLLTN